jgi:hypothetical protein
MIKKTAFWHFSKTSILKKTRLYFDSDAKDTQQVNIGTPFSQQEVVWPEEVPSRQVQQGKNLRQMIFIPAVSCYSSYLGIVTHVGID